MKMPILEALLESQRPPVVLKLVKTLLAKQNFNSDIGTRGMVGVPVMLFSALVKKETPHVTEIHPIPDCLALVSKANPE